jgi:hypothetical protein
LDVVNAVLHDRARARLSQRLILIKLVSIAAERDRGSGIESVDTKRSAVVKDRSVFGDHDLASESRIVAIDQQIGRANLSQVTGALDSIANPSERLRVNDRSGCHR